MKMAKFDIATLEATAKEPLLLKSVLLRCEVFDTSNEFRMVPLHGNDRHALPARGDNRIVGVLLASEHSDRPRCQIVDPFDKGGVIHIVPSRQYDSIAHGDRIPVLRLLLSRIEQGRLYERVPMIRG